MADAATDAQLVSRCRDGDEAAWNELVERFSRYVYAICVQAFRLAAARRRGRLPGGLRPRLRASRAAAQRRGDPALDRPADAAALHRPAAERRPRGHASTPDELEPAEVDETLARLDEALTVRAGLDAVGDPCREILDRFFCRDESYRTIGEALDIPAGHDREPDLALPREGFVPNSREDPTASSV